MNLEGFLDKVAELAKDDEIRREFEKGLKIQFTVDKEKVKVVALRPRGKQPG